MKTSSDISKFRSLDQYRVSKIEVSIKKVKIIMGLITLTDPRSPISEAYRTLRTNLSFSSLDRPLRTLVVTSAAPDEGKSETVANLAVTMAQGGRETILVDCDLRRPSLHTLFDLASEPGLTNLVLEEDGRPELQQTEDQNADHSQHANVVDLKPNFYGVGLNLNEAFRRFRQWWSSK